MTRGLFESVEVSGRPLRLPAMVPKLVDTPGRTDWAGPALGEHTDSVLQDILGLAEEDLEPLHQAGAIGRPGTTSQQDENL